MVVAVLPRKSRRRRRRRRRRKKCGVAPIVLLQFPLLLV
jgi:hypothetical protein